MHCRIYYIYITDRRPCWNRFDYNGFRISESLLPTRLLFIVGPHFDGNMCDYDIQIGPSYHCPITNMSMTELRCRITARSMLDPRTTHIVRVARYHQGYLANQNQVRFKFQPSISNITPMNGRYSWNCFRKTLFVSLFTYISGSIYGGTRVTIDGDGFMSDETLVFIAGANHTHLGSESYSRISFTTPPELMYKDWNLNLFVYVRTSLSVCLMPSCHFSWKTSITPYFDSVNPLIIRGATNLTITGRNLLSNGRTAANASVNIDGNLCNITQLSNNSISCTVIGMEAGEHPVAGSIDGQFF